MYEKSAFIFRRSLRLHDNTGLMQALKQSKVVVPIFIFTPTQLIKNPYKSENAVQFMIESLDALNQELKRRGSRLFCFFGLPEKVVSQIIKREGLEAVFVNHDYTKYSIRRDKQLLQACKKENVAFHAYEDLILNPLLSEESTFLNKSGNPYTKYTPFLRNALRKKVPSPQRNTRSNYLSSRRGIVGEIKSFSRFLTLNPKIVSHGGRKEVLKILKKVRTFSGYDKNRNYLIFATTRLSPYIKFGCVSIREVFHAFKKIKSKELIRQLYWRDFYYSIAYHFPHVFGKPMRDKYQKIKWPGKQASFKKWCLGQTGFPIVDACMRELNTTGFMHNRGRLITSNFLIKILLIDWRKGEKYFAQKLVDYDPSVNNGNWQWSASTGADSQPYFRVFNPWTQGKRFDPDCEYIKEWIPEIKAVPAKEIHRWDTFCKNYPDLKYPSPIVDYGKQRKSVLKLFR